ncbi:MAG: helix-turn-helix domain-containing protein [Rhodospirillaceae bacterium]|nr:helix-turn-helix domain-containing protein [Rhodospirillaceae bacterium]
MHDEAGPLNSPFPGGALPPCCCPLMFCATAGSRPWIDRLSHRFFEVSFADTLRDLVGAYLERTRTSARAFGLDVARDSGFVSARLAPGVSVRLDTADEVLEFIGEPPFGPLFRAEVEAYLAVTGTKAYLLGQLVLNDDAFVTRLRRGLSPTLETVEKVRRWMGEHSTAADRRAIAAATLHARWWRLGGETAGGTDRGREQREAALPRFLTTRQAAEAYAVSARKLERMRAAGEGPAYHRFGHEIRYAVADLVEWAASCRTEPAAHGAG